MLPISIMLTSALDPVSSPTTDSDRWPIFQPPFWLLRISCCSWISPFPSTIRNTESASVEHPTARPTPTRHCLSRSRGRPGHAMAFHVATDLNEVFICRQVTRTTSLRSFQLPFNRRKRGTTSRQGRQLSDQKCSTHTRSPCPAMLQVLPSNVFTDALGRLGRFFASAASVVTPIRSKMHKVKAANPVFIRTPVSDRQSRCGKTRPHHVSRVTIRSVVQSP